MDKLNIIDFKEAKKKIILKRIRETPTAILVRKMMQNPEFNAVMELLKKENENEII
jgi:hypothetical protein